MPNPIARTVGLALVLASLQPGRAADAEAARKQAEEMERVIKEMDARAVRVFEAVQPKGRDWLPFDSLPEATEAELSRLDALCDAPRVTLMGLVVEKRTDTCNRERFTNPGNPDDGKLRKADLFGDGRVSLIYSGNAPYPGEYNATYVWLDVAKPETGYVFLLGSLLKVRPAHGDEGPGAVSYNVESGGSDVAHHEVSELLTGLSFTIESTAGTDVPVNAVTAARAFRMPGKTELWTDPGKEPTRYDPNDYEPSMPGDIEAGALAGQLMTAPDAKDVSWSFVAAPGSRRADWSCRSGGCRPRPSPRSAEADSAPRSRMKAVAMAWFPAKPIELPSAGMRRRMAWTVPLVFVLVPHLSVAQTQGTTADEDAYKKRVAEQNRIIAEEVDRLVVRDDARALRILNMVKPQTKEWIPYASLPDATEAELSRLDDLCKAPKATMIGLVDDPAPDGCGRSSFRTSDGGTLKKADLFGDGRVSLIYSGPEPFSEGPGTYVWLDVSKPETGYAHFSSLAFKLQPPRKGETPRIVTRRAGALGTYEHLLASLTSGVGLIIQSADGTDVPANAVRADRTFTLTDKTALWLAPGEEPAPRGPDSAFEVGPPPDFEADTVVRQVLTAPDAKGNPWSFVATFRFEERGAILQLGWMPSPALSKAP